jgi:hypothetical protein
VGTIRKDERDRRREQNQARMVKFRIGQEVIATVRDFKYLGRISSDDDDDLPAVRENMKKTRKRWARVSRLLVREGATAKMMGKIYLAVVQSVLLYIRDMGTFRANERHAGRLPQSMRETNDEAVHTPRPRERRRMDYTTSRYHVGSGWLTATDDLC